MNSWYSFYDLKTGIFLQQWYQGKFVADNTPQGCKAMRGRFDPHVDCVDLQTGEIIDRSQAQTDN